MNLIVRLEVRRARCYLERDERRKKKEEEENETATDLFHSASDDAITVRSRDDIRKRSIVETLSVVRVHKKASISYPQRL